MAVPPICKASKSAHFEFAKDSIPRFDCLLTAVEHILRTPPKELNRSINRTKTHQSRKRNFGRQSSTSSSCGRKAGKEGQNASRGTSRARKARCTTEHWVKESKEQASYACARSRGNHRQSKSFERKAKSKYGTCAGLWFDRRWHKAKTSHGRFKYRE